MSVESRNIVDQNRFFLTGSDFSELAVLENPLINELNSSVGGNRDVTAESSLKTAKFKKIDWQAVEKNLIKNQASMNSQKVQQLMQQRRNTTTNTKKLAIERQSLEQLSDGGPDEILERDSVRQVDWANYLPRLRKDLQGQHPKDLQGQIWPQKKRSITYNSGVVSPVAGSAQQRYIREKRKGQAPAQHLFEIRDERQSKLKKSVSPTSNLHYSNAQDSIFGVNMSREDSIMAQIAAHQLQLHHQHSSQASAMAGEPTQSKPATKEDMRRSHMQEHHKGTASNNKVVVTNEEPAVESADQTSMMPAIVGKQIEMSVIEDDLANTKYDQTFYQPQISNAAMTGGIKVPGQYDQTFQQRDQEAGPSQMGIATSMQSSHGGITFRTSHQRNQFLSPRFTRGSNDMNAIGAGGFADIAASKGRQGKSPGHYKKNDMAAFDQSFMKVQMQKHGNEENLMMMTGSPAQKQKHLQLQTMMEDASRLTTKRRSPDRAFSKIASETETLLDQGDVSQNRDLQMGSPFAHHLSTMAPSGGNITPYGVATGAPGSNVGSQQVAYKVNFKPLNNESEFQSSANRSKIKKQPTQLNISTITPKPIEKGQNRASPQGGKQKSMSRHKKVFSNIIDSAESLEKERVEQMQVIVNMKIKHGRKKSHFVEKSQMAMFNNSGTISKNTIGAVSFAGGTVVAGRPGAQNVAQVDFQSSRSPSDRNMSPFSRHNNQVLPETMTAAMANSAAIANKKNKQGKNERQRLEYQRSSPKDFTRAVRDLYRQEEESTYNAKGGVNSNKSSTFHHTSDYLNRVDQIREETSKHFSKGVGAAMGSSSSGGAPLGSSVASPAKTLEKNQTERQDFHHASQLPHSIEGGVKIFNDSNNGLESAVQMSAQIEVNEDDDQHQYQRLLQRNNQNAVAKKKLSINQIGGTLNPIQSIKQKESKTARSSRKMSDHDHQMLIGRTLLDQVSKAGSSAATKGKLAKQLKGEVSQALSIDNDLSINAQGAVITKGSKTEFLKQHQLQKVKDGKKKGESTDENGAYLLSNGNFTDSQAEPDSKAYQAEGDSKANSGKNDDIKPMLKQLDVHIGNDEEGQELNSAILPKSMERVISLVEGGSNSEHQDLQVQPKTVFMHSPGKSRDSVKPLKLQGKGGIGQSPIHTENHSGGEEEDETMVNSGAALHMQESLENVGSHTDHAMVSPRYHNKSNGFDKKRSSDNKIGKSESKNNARQSPREESSQARENKKNRDVAVENQKSKEDEKVSDRASKLKLKLATESSEAQKESKLSNRKQIIGVVDNRPEAEVTAQMNTQVQAGIEGNIHMLSARQALSKHETLALGDSFRLGAGGALTSKHLPNALLKRNSQNKTTQQQQIVQLEGIYVRRPNELNPIMVMGNSRNIEQMRQSGRKMSVPPPPKSPLKTKQLNLASIPDSIRTDALITTGLTVGPKNKFRSISTSRPTQADGRTPLKNSSAADDPLCKAKRVEDIETILNRVVRAKCCLQPANPEQFEVMRRAVGDGSDYLQTPSKKALRIRLKFLNNKFLQNVTEDFMSIQNLERQVDQTIIATDDLFRQYEIEDKQEQQLMVRLFKRFYFSTIERKYGYQKPFVKEDKVEVSGRTLCSELEINPKILPLSGVITVFSQDATLNWISFLKIMCLFLLQKPLIGHRFEFILRFLKVTNSNVEVLERADYMQERMQRFQFAKRGSVVCDVPTLVLWNKIRLELQKKREAIFGVVEPGTLNMHEAVKALVEGGITAEDTHCFFDSLFDIQ